MKHKFVKHRHYHPVGEVNSKAFHTTIEIGSYGPEAFKYTGAWVDYTKQVSKRIASFISKAKPDEYNASSLDSEIDTQRLCMQASANSQAVSHHRVINHNSHILAGELVRANEMANLLQADLAEINAAIDKLSNM